MNLHYVAGLIDGEGCIRIEKPGHLVLSIGSCYKPVIESLQEAFGCGGINPVSKKKGAKTCYKLVIGTNNAERILRLVEPYLLEKREQALIAIEYQERKNRDYHTPKPLALINEYRQKLTELKSKSY